MYAAQKMTIPVELARVRSEARQLRGENSFLKQQTVKYKQARIEQEKRIKELEDANQQKDIRIKQLEEQMDKITWERDRYKQLLTEKYTSHQKQQTKPSKTHEAQAIQVNSYVRNRGRKDGHAGSGRTLPERIDEIIRCFLSQCPHCQCGLTRTSGITTHIVEDIPAPDTLHTTVTKYEIERQWCGRCKQEVRADPVEVIPHSRLGINTLIQTMIRYYREHDTLSQIAQAYADTYGLHVSRGTLQGVLAKAKEYLTDEYDRLLTVIRGSPVKHGDETTWPISGIDEWLWGCFTNSAVCYVVDETRGKDVATRQFAGSKETDVLVSDDYAVYEHIGMRRQSCWAHLLRKARDYAQLPTASQEITALKEELGAMFEQLSTHLATPYEKNSRLHQHEEEKARLDTIIQRQYDSEDARKVQKRIRKQYTNLLTALLYADVPLTNNLAERLIRQPVIKRKISGGSKTKTGAKIFAVNMSVLQSLVLQNKNLYPELKKLILIAIGKN